MLIWVLAIVVVLAILGYIVGAPSDARAAAAPRCTQQNPCTAKEAALLKRLGQAGAVEDDGTSFTKIAKGGTTCTTAIARRRVHSVAPSHPTMFWGTMVKTWCYTNKGVITYSPKAKVTYGVTGFGNAIGYHDVNVDQTIEQRYPWRGDLRKGSWSWRFLTAKQEVPVINLGIFHLRTATFALTIRAHGDGTHTSNDNGS